MTDHMKDDGTPVIRQTISLRSTDGYQLARAGEAMEDLRLVVKEEFDRGNLEFLAYKVIEEARRTLADALEKLGGS
jgi:hypothetical protein